MKILKRGIRDVIASEVLPEGRGFVLMELSSGERAFTDILSAPLFRLIDIDHHEK